MPTLKFLLCGGLAFLTCVWSQGSWTADPNGNPGGRCEFNFDTSTGTSDCSFSVPLAGEYTFTTCNDGSSGSMCTVMDNAQLSLLVDGQPGTSAMCGDGICPRMTYNVGMAGFITLRQECTSTGEPGGSCSGTTVVTFTGETPSPTMFPTNTAFSTDPGQLCDPINLPASMDETYRSCMFNPTASQVKFTMCNRDINGDLPSAFNDAMCDSGVNLNVFTASGGSINTISRSQSECFCQDLIIDFSSGNSEGPYELRQICPGPTGCTGRTAIFSLPDLTAEPTTKPTNMVFSADPGGLCPQFEHVPDPINAAYQDTSICSFNPTEGLIKLTFNAKDALGEDYPNGVAAGASCGAYTGGQLDLRVFNRDDQEVDANIYDGWNSCREAIIVVDPTMAGMGPFQLRVMCAGGNECSGRAAIFLVPATAEPTLSPTNGAFDTFPGALCPDFDLPADPNFSGAIYKDCMFTPRGIVKVSMCDSPLGNVRCDFNVNLEILAESGALAVEVTYAQCGCPEIVYDFTANGAHEVHHLRQTCSDGQPCSGTAAIFSVNPQSDVGSLSIGDGAVCGAFAGFSGVDYVSCYFNACGGAMRISQLPEDNTISNYNGESPGCVGNTFLELYRSGGGRVAYYEGNDEGYTGCTRLDTLLDYDGCSQYEIRQTCSNGGECSGRTGVYLFDSPTVEPSYPPTLFPTQATFSTSPGDLCEEFRVEANSGSWGHFKSCMFTPTSGVVKFVMCNTDSNNNVRPSPFDGAQCDGRVKLRLFAGGNEVDLSAVTNDPVCDCPQFEYDFTNNNSDGPYELRQSCVDEVDGCYSHVGIFSEAASTPEPTYDPTPNPTLNPTRIPTSEPTVYVPPDLGQITVGSGGVCDPYSIVNGAEGEYRSCLFTACTGYLRVSQCPLDNIIPNYTGEDPACTASTSLSLYRVGDPQQIASIQGGGDGSCQAGCSKIETVLTYIANLGNTNECSQYELRQGCVSGSNTCGGRTGVYLLNPLTAEPTTAPTDDPSFLPTAEPSDAAPTAAPQPNPTATPTAAPQATPTVAPQSDPTVTPSANPTTAPQSTPTVAPQATPTLPPQADPTAAPQAGPTVAPQATPTVAPRADPTSAPVPLSPLNFRADTYKVKNGFAFAARASDGTVHTWGEAPYGGDSEDAVFGNVTSVVSSRFAFVAVNLDRTIVPWGARTAIVGASSGQVTGLVASEAAFAGVLSVTGGVLALGSKHNGGDVTSDARCNGFSDELSSGVKSITAAACAFTALKNDGTAYSWGNVHCGAGVSSVSNTALVGVQKVVATREAFAALLSTGAVKVWGGSLAGGDASSAGSELDNGVVNIVAGRDVFVAVKTGGKLVVWGYGPYGGDTSLVQQHLDSGVTSVAHTFTAFAALKDTGEVHTWGRADSGGDSSAVSAQLHDIVSIHGAGKAFAAINSTGGVVAWGKAAYGGVIPADKRVALSSGVVSIHSTDRAFVALKADGGVVVWGQAGHGGSPGVAVEALLARRPVHTVCSNDAAFSAINTDGEVIGWGHPVSIAAPGVIFSSDSLKVTAKCD